MAKATGVRSAGPSWTRVVIAVLLPAVFLGCEPSADATVQEDATGEAAPTGQVVPAAEFESGVDSFIGQQIQLENVRVVSKMGPEALWIELPSGAPYLVKTDAATSAALPAQAVVTVVGRVLAKTDSVLNAWEQSGAIQNEGHRAQAEYGTSFIEASSVRQGGA